MIALLLSSFLTFLLILIWGILVSKYLNVNLFLPEALMLGFLSLNSLTTIISIFFPINYILLLILIGTSLIIFNLYGKEFRVIGFISVLNKKTILISLPFIIIAFLLSLTPLRLYDTGLYHLQSVYWIQEYSAVPGLANLHSRFGFNPNIFTLHPLFSLEELFHQNIYSIHFVIFVILVFYFINRLVAVYNWRGFSNYFLFYTILFLFLIMNRSEFSSISPDYFNSVLPLFIFARIIDLNLLKKEIQLKYYYPIFLLSLYLITVKLAALPILLFFPFVLYKYREKVSKIKYSILLVALVIVLPWLIRNIILTGWLIFPFPTIDLFSFDWKVPEEDVQVLGNTIKGWARFQDDGYLEVAKMGLQEWFPIWWKRMDLNFQLLFITSLLFPAIVILWQIIYRPKVNLLFNGVVITSIIGVIFWLFMAPDIRFARTLLLIASISPSLFIKFNWVSLNSKYVSFGIGLFILLIFSNFLYNDYKKYTPGPSIFLKPIPVKAPSNLQFHTFNLEGIDIYVPKTSDRCYNHPIPCTIPSIDFKKINLRGDDLKSGFKVEGNY